MKVTFLGTGTSSGVPMIGCDCKVCISKHPHDQRMRSSVLLTIQDKNYAIDCGPDFRQQMLNNQVKTLHGILYTHEHHDHTSGLDDIRGYNYFMNQPMKLYLTERVEKAIRREFAYIFDENKYPGIPEVTLERIHEQADFMLDSGTLVTPIEVMHLRLPVLGFKIGTFAYITDANYISEASIQKLKDVDTLVLNALRHEKHISHFTLAEAIQMSRNIGAKQTYFTHISHQLGLHQEVSESLPEGFALAYDGLTIEV